jgi:hypothetical protein
MTSATSPASADIPNAGTSCAPTDPTCSVDVTDAGSPGSSSPGSKPVSSSSGPPTVVCEIYTDHEIPGVGRPSADSAYGTISDTSKIPDGEKVFQACTDLATGLPSGPITPITWKAGAAPRETPEQVAAKAVGSIRFDPPAVRVWPGDGRPGLVGMPVILHTDSFLPLSASATSRDGTLTATVIATPTEVVWNMEEDVVTCHDRGSTWDEVAPVPERASCKYVYRRSSGARPGQAYRASATIRWNVTWTVTGDAAPRVIGPRQATSAPFAVQIQESQALIVPSS